MCLLVMGFPTELFNTNFPDNVQFIRLLRTTNACWVEMDGAVHVLYRIEEPVLTVCLPFGQTTSQAPRRCDCTFFPPPFV
jgi:hypothetical protein